ncbi:hypothetical protein SAM40697_5228 [Streptomyces ambofaciens]|uniref:Bacterial Ig-like domain-containing protein n=1 Tax=Streptomyces ambofaciens TaxID=1889 RepID=A0ABN4PDG7_STRAM|nr:hypothetical protein [Streptomyces ambofaciens]ANB09184.1 hypothetical protein SAM40697_5228 [Streptomyces ambofaciens]
MPKAASKARQIITGIDTSGAHPVEYRFAHAKKGNRHLTVVFANLAAPDDYGWSTGTLDDLRSNILWIRDRFDGGLTYYLCREMDFSVERSVIDLITKVVSALGLTPNDVTLWGSSKGASAALWFGLRYGFRNIVACVPQFRIGTFVREVYPKVGRSMLGEGLPEENARVLDAILPDLLRAGASPEANIYLVSSPQDEQYRDQVEPFLDLLRRYPHFNYIHSESPFVREHNQVTLRNVPPLLGIAYLLVEGITPRLGVTRHGYEEPDRDTSAIDGFLGATAKVKEGAAFRPPVVTVPAAGGRLPPTDTPFRGTAPGAVRVSLWEKGKFLASPPVAADGTWSWAPSKPWAEGEHRVKIFAVDGAGFHSATTEVRFTATRDAAPGTPPPDGPGPAAQAAWPAAPVLRPPVVSLPAAHQQVAGTAVVFRGIAPGAVQVRFRGNGALLGMNGVRPDGTWSWEPGLPWPEGPHLVEAVAVDADGVESVPVQVPFAVAPTAAPAGSFTPRY